MAYIKVDYSKMVSAASAVENYITLMKSKMGKAQGEVATLSTSWQGADFIQFKAQWDKLTANDSTYTQMIKSLESYSKYLRYAANEYEKAQNKAVNRANNLPKF